MSWDDAACRRSRTLRAEGTFCVHPTSLRPKLTVTADGTGVVAHAGTRLLTDLAGATGLTRTFSNALGGLRRRDTGHDPGRVAVDVAVMLADGGEAISDLVVLRDQPDLFGPVASTSTAWRVLAGIGPQELAALHTARAQAREVAWAHAAETAGGIPPARAGGRDIPGLVIDLDASVVITHSEKEDAAATFKHSFGYHPLLGFLDNTGEALAAILRPGNAGSNTAADHIAVLDACLTQIPDHHRHGTPILIRTDSAGHTREFLTHIRSLRARGVDIRFSIGVPVTATIREMLAWLVDQPDIWTPALDPDAGLREDAEICEITHLIDTSAYPAGTRIIARRERPHPGAQLSLFDEATGWRHQIFATDTPHADAPLQHLEVRHRAHARVEDRIRCGKTTGFGRFPSRHFAINAAWLQLALTAIDLLTWLQLLLLDGELVYAEPKKLRYRLLHVAARLTRGGRRLRLRIAATWPWRHHLLTAYARLEALPQSAT
ncbi:IS1380 family transposase [Micromonospora sp. MS34]|uniref:IS1380 family transposase n=1 Tax=Micromonospora sp. MS34 TaxID=3385971 RepID=UPI0039A05690